MSISIRILPALALAALVSAVAASPPARADTAPVSLDEAYRQIKDAERGIPAPAPEATVDMGTYDAATGEFDGLATEVIVFNGKPTRIVPQVTVNAVNATLVFHLVNAAQLVRLSVGGAGTAIARAGSTSISIDAGRLHDVRWTLRSGTKSHGDELTVNRPRIIGAGAFTIKALPIAVVYDAPQDPARSNTVVYSRTKSIGTTIGMSVRSGSSTSTPSVTPSFSALGMFHDQLSGAAAFASAVGSSGTATALTKIVDVLGKASRNVTTTEDATSTLTRTYTFTESHSCGVEPGVSHLGPGRTDLVVYLRNVRLIWLDDGFRTYVHLLGYQSLECPTVDQLRSGVAGLDPATAAPLVALDPFTGPLGAKTPIASDPRYVPLPGIGLLPNVVTTATYQQQVIVDQSHTDAYTRVVSDDLGAGLLSLVGLAPGQTQQVSTTLSVSNNASSNEATAVTTALTARTLVPGIRTELAVFYDRVFGNIAFQDPRP